MPTSPASTLPEHVTVALERRPTCIVVSQGTTDNRDPDKLFRPALQALAGSEHLVIVTTGGRHTERLRREFPQDNVLVEDWLPFSVLLPQANAFVCNGGFGSVLLALSSGVPLICAGKLEGKSDINARIAFRGLGIDLRTERPTPRQIREGVADILADRGHAARVRDARAALERYRPLQIIDDTLARDGIVPPAAERQPATMEAAS
jgi:UDP:flavonoid glycosyltransferase YjiC (YdhE family)